MVFRSSQARRKPPENSNLKRSNLLGADHPVEEPGYLTRDQVKDLWEAASFLVQEYGVLLNVRMTIRYSRFGIADPKAATGHLTRMNQEIRQRLARAKKGARYPFHWLYVHERMSEGLVTRIAAYIPEEGRGLEQWLRESFLPRRVGRSVRSDALTYRRYEFGNSQSAIRRHFLLVRLLCRGINPIIEEDVYSGKLLVRKARLINLIGIPKLYHGPVGEISDVHRFGTSRHLAHKARNDVAKGGLPMLSAFAPEAWEYIGKGWELAEHRDRETTKMECARQEAEIKRKFRGSTQLERTALEEALRVWRQAWPKRAYDRPRTWQAWLPRL